MGEGGRRPGEGKIIRSNQKDLQGSQSLGGLFIVIVPDTSFCIQHFYSVVVSEHAEMVIKGKDVIDAVCVDKGKACTVGKTQAREVIFAKDRRCDHFGILSYSQHAYTEPPEIFHESYCGKMASPCADECIGFIKDIVGGKLYGIAAKCLLK